MACRWKQRCSGIVRRQLKRRYVLTFFQKLSPRLVGIEACASSHHWSRQLHALGHTVRLIPPAYVKPYVKRQKNDATDAEAICEAVTRANVRFVPTKTPSSRSPRPLLSQRSRRRCRQRHPIRRRPQLPAYPRMAESSFVSVPDRGLAPFDQPISAQSGLLTDNFISSDSLPLDDPASASPISERRGPPLTIKAHLAQLERRHHALEASIDEALAHELSKNLRDHGIEASEASSNGRDRAASTSAQLSPTISR